MNFKMFGKLEPGMCRLSMNGIAVKVGTDYKTYDVNTGVLVNCADFVFDVGDDMFFVMPTNDVKKGDLILATNGPACVINVNENEIRAFDYKTGTIVSLVPERYVFFGGTYFYSKVVSMFGDVSGGMTPNNIMPYMMMSEMCKGSTSEFGKMAAMSMMFSGGAGMNFSNLFSGFSNNKTDSNEEVNA